MPELVKLKNGGMVPKDHPLYLQEQGSLPPEAQPRPVTPETNIEVKDTFGGPHNPDGTPTEHTVESPSSAPMTPAQAASAGLGWVPQGHPLYGTPGYVGSQPAAAAPGGAPAGASAPGGQPQNTQQVLNTPVSQAPPTTVTGAFQQALMNRLNQGPADASNPAISGAINANRVAEQRGEERQRRQLAAMAAAQGYDNSGAFDSQRLGLAQNRAEREADFAGNAVRDLARQQSQEIMSALALGGGMLSDQDRLALQERLANLDAQLRREGLSAQTSLGQGDLALRGELGRGQLNLGLLGALLQNQQFGQNLGANLGMFNASQDSSNLRALLGML